MINNAVKFQVYSKVIQLCTYLFFLKLFSHLRLSCYIILSRVLWAEQSNTEQSITVKSITLTAQASDQQFKSVVAQTQVLQALGGWASSHAPSFCIKSVRPLSFQKTFTLVRSPSHGYVMKWRNLISQASSWRKYCTCGKKWFALPLGREGKTPWTWPSAEGCCWSQRDQKSSSWEGRGGGWGKEWAWKSVLAPHTLIFTQGANLRPCLVQVGYQFYRVEGGEGVEHCHGWCRQNRGRQTLSWRGRSGREALLESGLQLSTGHPPPPPPLALLYACEAQLKSLSLQRDV